VLHYCVTNRRGGQGSSVRLAGGANSAGAARCARTTRRGGGIDCVIEDCHKKNIGGSAARTAHMALICGVRRDSLLKYEQ